MKKVFSLHNRVAMVTGATGLLGRQHCLALAEAGASVVVLDLDETSCRQLAADLSRTAPAAALGLACDVTDEESIRDALKVTLEKFDRVDVLINNAAINEKVEDPGGGSSDLETYPLALWQKALDVNVTGTFLCSQVVGSEMARRGKGSIINIASTYGVVAPDPSIYRRADGTQLFFKSPAYPTTKGAVIALTRYLAAYWGSAGVRVNALSPGGVENGQDEDFIANYSSRTPLGRMAKPADYKGAIVFLAGEASNYMTGANLIIDGGWTAW